MGSASRSALEAGIAALDAATGVTLVTGEELLAAARAVEGNAQLRAMLSDPTLAPEERAALVARAFGTLSATSRSLLAGLAGSRWSNPAQLIDGIEEIAVRAIARSQADVDVVGELFAVERAVASDAELELALGSKLASGDAKAALVSKLLQQQGSEATTAIVRHLVRSPRGRRIGAMLRHAAEIVADVAGAVVARVTVAAPLTPAARTALERDLAERMGRSPRIHYVIDPAVLGGVRVRVGDTVIDGTIASRLADLRLQLAG